MTEQYWIDGFFIDVSRNQITVERNGESITQVLPPKAIAVLTYLAINQGKVISQETLLSEVWQETIVSSNTLQRCIAQLRKAFGDDGKAQGFIKTHAKRGYSLECPVDWQKEPVQQPIETANLDTATPDVNCQIQTTSEHKRQGRWPLVVVAMLVSMVLLYSPIKKILIGVENSEIVIKEIRPITSTDNRELASLYSPDGDFVVFKRYPEVMCFNNLWAKNLNTQEEFQLTEDLGSYESLSFSKDGTTLAFIKHENCQQPVTQKRCFRLQSIDFQAAIGTSQKNGLPQTPSTLMECNNTEIRKAKWVDKGAVTLLQRDNNRWKLIRYSVSNNESQTLYDLPDGNLVSYDYSPSQDLIALISIKGDGQQYIETLRPGGELLSSHKIKFPQDVPKFRRIYPNFSSHSEQLIFSTGRQLFTLSYDGEVRKISVPLLEPMGTPVFHPKSERMLAIKGHYDSDIVSVPLSQFNKSAQPSDKFVLDYTVLDRSTFGEYDAKVQPGGSLIAFTSGRSGNSQIWLKDTNASSEADPRQLSNLRLDTYVHDFAWAQDSESVLASISSELKQIYLDGREVIFDSEYPVERLFHWDSANNIAVGMIEIQGVMTFVELHLESRQVHTINSKQINLARKSENGTLIYTDKLERFWRVEGLEDKLIAPLEKQGSDKDFIIKDNVIYGINDDFQLWSYDLNKGAFSVIGSLPNTIDYLTDFDGEHFYMTMRIAARKDVVELVLD